MDGIIWVVVFLSLVMSSGGEGAAVVLDPSMT